MPAPAGKDNPVDAAQALAFAGARLEGASRWSRRDSERLLCHVLGCNLAALLAWPERRLTPPELRRYEECVSRRAGGEPIQYIVGEQEFFGLRIGVSPAVLIPRPETEFLVEALLGLTADLPARPGILDVGTGSGAIALAVAANLLEASLTAVDLSPAALAVAHANARRLQLEGRIRFLESDLLSAVRGERFDAIAANLPYVPASERLEREVADYEPRLALFAGPGGMEVYERLIPQARLALRPGGWLLAEIGHGQRPAMTQLLDGWRRLSFVADLQGIPRVACAQNPD